MANTRISYVEGVRIDDVWREVMWLCVMQGYDFVVKGGSYIGQIRKQLPIAVLRIKEPGKRPLAPIVPPPWPSPTSEEKIEKYFLRYLMEDKLEQNEQYTYGSYIKPQVQRIIELLLNSNGNTNQACISVGDRESAFLPDPPCLRVISFKVVNGKLNMTVFFRSWDLFAGLPENLGGLQMLKEYVLAHLDGLNLVDGDLIAYSDGLHIYDQYFELVNALNVDKIVVDENVLRDKASFAKTLE